MIRYMNASYTDPKNTTIRVNIDGTTSFVPADPSNSDYARICKLVKDGELTIQPYVEAPTP